uniref:Beta-defensin n=1 Tax=Felis catus TaxID=9685 RepID=A0ABI8AEJ4_FELCA
MTLPKTTRPYLFMLLLVRSQDTARPRKCFSNITGYCRKKCEMGEIYEVACRNGKLCCVNEGENKKHKKAPKSPSFLVQPDGKMDYVILPTTTLLTIQI